MTHHLMIGGTGRAGTSFLVQYLHLCGSDTVIGTDGMSTWSDEANAGLETYSSDGEGMPYVIKSGWFHEFVDRLVHDESIILDAAIIPTRDLVEAAASRVINDHQARFRDPAVPAECTTWERWGTTPGGVVYSLNPMDQARILAMSFHTAIHSLVRHNVPIVFLDFPRFIEDPEYLYDKLRPYLPVACDPEKAYAAHQEIADRDKVRTGREIHATQNAPASDGEVSDPSIHYPTTQALNNIARERHLKSGPRRPRSVAERMLSLLRRIRTGIDAAFRGGPIL